MPGLVTVVLKRIIGRARPMYLDELGPLDFRAVRHARLELHSFPSGHSTTASWPLQFSCVTLTNGRFSGGSSDWGLLIGTQPDCGGRPLSLTTCWPGSFVGTVVAILVRDYFVTRNWGMRMERGKRRLPHVFSLQAHLALAAPPVTSPKLLK